jgi:hypothetical protein
MGKKRRTDRPEAFADVVEETADVSPDLGGEPMEIKSPIRDRRFIDHHGLPWQMRRGDLRWSRIEHLIRDPEVPVLHVYLHEIKGVPIEERETLLATIRPYLKPARGGTEPSDHTDFLAAEFKGDDHRSMLVIEESC